MLLQNVGNVTDLITKHHKNLVVHSGRGITLNEIHNSGHFIPDANSAVKNPIFDSVQYRRHKGRVGEQI